MTCCRNTGDDVFAFRHCEKHTSQSAAEMFWLALPNHTTSIRPALPAATHGNTLVSVALGSSTIAGMDQVAPWSAEYEDRMCRSFDHTVYTVPSSPTLTTSNRWPWPVLSSTSNVLQVVTPSVDRLT